MDYKHYTPLVVKFRRKKRMLAMLNFAAGSNMSELQLCHQRKSKVCTMVIRSNVGKFLSLAWFLAQQQIARYIAAAGPFPGSK